MPHPLSTASRIDEQQIRALPKAEVHVHLEGTFSLIDLLALAKENGVRLPGPAATIFDISTHAGYTAPGVTSGGGSGAGSAGLTGFLRFLDWQCGLVRTPEQAARVAYAFAARQTAAGVLQRRHREPDALERLARPRTGSPGRTRRGIRRG